MKSRPVAARILSITFMFLLFIALVVLIFPALGFPQSSVANDVKHDTPGQVIKQGQTVHIDVDLALVNVTVTDPYSEARSS